MQPKTEPQKKKKKNFPFDFEQSQRTEKSQ